jgi:putative flippase GtrA
LSQKALFQCGRFAFVGGLGFLLDACITLALIGRGIDPFTARIIAIALAMMVNWRLHRSVTFGASDTSQATEGIRYFTVALLAAALNYAIYVALLLFVPFVSPLMAIIIAIGTVTALTFVGYRNLVFKNAA